MTRLIIILAIVIVLGTVAPAIASPIYEDWVACGAYLERSGLFTIDEMQPICIQLIVNGQYTDPDFQDRGLIIYWVELGETVRLPIP